MDNPLTAEVVTAGIPGLMPAQPLVVHPSPRQRVSCNSLRLIPGREPGRVVVEEPPERRGHRALSDPDLVKAGFQVVLDCTGRQVQPAGDPARGEPRATSWVTARSCSFRPYASAISGASWWAWVVRGSRSACPFEPSPNSGPRYEQPPSRRRAVRAAAGGWRVFPVTASLALRATATSTDWSVSCRGS